MVDRETLLRERILALRPDLEIRSIEIHAEGLVNDVAIVNDAWVFRFPRNAAAEDVLAHENQILDLVRPRVSIQVPTPVTLGRDAMVYPLLPGRPLTRRLLWDLSGRDRTRIAEQLGNFLYALHTTAEIDAAQAIPRTRAPATRERHLDLRDRVRRLVYPLLLPHQVEWAEALFATALDEPGFFDYEPALVHADLAPYHILLDPDACEVTGVIDFGVAGMGDAAQDLGILMTVYGESFVVEMTGGYPGVAALLPRARFYAQRIELEWVVLGLETGETFWFTAHLGAARDIRA